MCEYTDFYDDFYGGSGYFLGPRGLPDFDAVGQVPEDCREQDDEGAVIDEQEDCDCCLPEQSCPACRAAARRVYGDEELPF